MIMRTKATILLIIIQTILIINGIDYIYEKKIEFGIFLIILNSIGLTINCINLSGLIDLK